MYCEVCGGLGVHRNGCPDGYPRKRAKHICCKCEEGIFNDEEYVESLYGDIAHLDCICGLTTRELLDWLKIDVMRMNDYD